MKLHKALALSTVLAILMGAAAGCGLFGSSPTSTLKAFYTATRNKDAEGIKKTLSKGTIGMLEEFAKRQGKSLDEALKSGLAKSESSSDKMPEMRNEKIEGDKATLEVLNEKTGQWETLPFVKEDGSWKIAFDQLYREASQSEEKSNSNK